MIVKDGRHRCDVCSKISEGQDKFSGFYMPPSVSAITGRPDGRFPGIGRAGKPDQLVQLHACPACKPKVKGCVETHDFTMLPSGPLKKILMECVSLDMLRNLKIGRAH